MTATAEVARVRAAIVQLHAERRLYVASGRLRVGDGSGEYDKVEERRPTCVYRVTMGRGER